MAPKVSSAAKGAAKRDEKTVVAAQPAKVVAATQPAKPAGVSYLSMLQKSAPVAAPVAAAPAAAAAPATSKGNTVVTFETPVATTAVLPPPKPKAAPALVDLPGSTAPVAKQTGAWGKKAQPQEAPVVVAAAPVEEPQAVVVEPVVEEPVAQPEVVVPEVEAATIEVTEEEVTVVEEEEVVPDVVVEVATPLAEAPSSPEKLTAEESSEVHQPLSQPHLEEAKEELAPPARITNWADVEPGYSAFSNHHNLFGAVSPVTLEEEAAATQAEVPTKLVSFRNDRDVSRRYKFAAPTNDKLVTSLLQAIRVREEAVAQREAQVRHQADEVGRREVALNQETLKLTNERQNLARDREELTRQQTQFQLQQSQQPQSRDNHSQNQSHSHSHSQPQPAHVHHHHHHISHSQPSSYHQRQSHHNNFHGGVGPMGHNQQHMGWEDDATNYNDYDYQHMGHYPQHNMAAARYGRPTQQRGPQGGAPYNNRMPPQQMMYSQQSNYNRPPRNQGNPMHGGYNDGFQGQQQPNHW